MNSIRPRRQTEHADGRHAAAVARIAVLVTGGFSLAAKATPLSQAALSGLIKQLETRVGVRLLDRSIRRVSPSAVGDAFDPMGW